MTVDQILATLAQARSGSGRLLLEEYSSQDGKVTTHELKLGGPDLYVTLMRDTAQWLKDVSDSDKPQHVIQYRSLCGLATVEEVERVLREALVKLETKLAAPPDSTASKQASVQGDHNLFEGTSGPQLRNIVSVRSEVVQEVPFTGKTRVSKPDDSSARVKKAMEKAWPLSSYGVSFTLLPGRFKSLTALP